MADNTQSRQGTGNQATRQPGNQAQSKLNTADAFL